MKAVFLDRDGVINRYPGDKKYVTDCKGFRLLPGVKRAIAELHRNGFRIFVISNQAGVGKGIFSQRALDAITSKMLCAIEGAGGRIEAVYYCIHRKEENCPCRKPKAGMIDIAKKGRSIKTKGSFFVGDTIRDVHTARQAGCKSILVLSGKEKFSNRKNWEIQPDFVFKDLYRATKFIINQK